MTRKLLRDRACLLASNACSWEDEGEIDAPQPDCANSQTGALTHPTRRDRGGELV